MLGPMEFETITITLPVDYNRSITHMYAHYHRSLDVKYNSHNLQINLEKSPTTLISTL